MIELNSKIFTYDARLATGDLTKIKEHDNENLTELFKKLKCMKGIDA